ncbi:MAG: glycerol kinase GlpK [Bacilli bacterium]|nr:glycerol kinase GlpK [Bacilli bacterium]
MKKYILTIDQGTTSTRSILFDKKANIVSISQMEIEQICPHDGWVEHNPSEIWMKTYQTIENVIKQSKVSVSEIAGIAITNQRETSILWDKNTGEEIYNAVVWQSRQSQPICDKLISDGYEELILSKTGLVINSYFSGSKIAWMLENVPGAREKALNNELRFGTIDCFLLSKLTNNKVHATDYTNASRTMLYNIYDLKWDEELLKILNIPASILPEVLDSNAIFGYATGLSNIDKAFNEIPIASMIGDQQASLFGQCCFEQGDAKNTYGTGCFMLMNTKKPIKNPGYGLLSTIAWGIDGKLEYALEGSVFIAGAGVQWLRDMMEFFEQSKECEKALKDKNPSGGVYLVPAFVGLGTPYWDSDARGAIFGITRTTTKNHITAATIEAIAYQTKDVLDVMEEASGVKIKTMGVDGGACVNSYLMQFQADLLNVTLKRPICKETTALGATYICGLKVGLFESKEEVINLHLIDSMFTSSMKQEKREQLIKGWKKAVNATLQYK